MKHSTNLDLESLRVLYQQYKEFIIPVTMIVVSVVLFFFVVIPQIKDIITSREEAQKTAEKVKALNTNIDLLSKISDATLNDDLTTAATALPPVKDYIGILTAISLASKRSGVGIEDYSFQVGAVSGTLSGVALPKNQSSTDIEFSLVVHGSLLSTQQFIQMLSQTLPLSNISSITSDNDTGATVKMVFYYKPFFKTVSDNPSSPITYLSAENRQTLDQLKKWNGPNSQVDQSDLFPSF